MVMHIGQLARLLNIISHKINNTLDIQSYCKMKKTWKHMISTVKQTQNMPQQNTFEADLAVSGLNTEQFIRLSNLLCVVTEKLTLSVIHTKFSHTKSE